MDQRPLAVCNAFENKSYYKSIPSWNLSVKHEKWVDCFATNSGGNRIGAIVLQTLMKCPVTLKGGVWETGRAILPAGSTT